MASDLERAAVKCVNEFVERADGNWSRAKRLWAEELQWMPYGWKYRRYVREVFRAFKAMKPTAR